MYWSQWGDLTLCVLLTLCKWYVKMISRSHFGVLFVVLVCVRINSCVGQANHRSFLLTLVFFLLTSLYGISLVLQSVCPDQNVMTALFYCPDVYNQFRFGSKYTNSQKCFLLYLIQLVLTLFSDLSEHLCSFQFIRKGHFAASNVLYLHHIST